MTPLWLVITLGSLAYLGIGVRLVRLLAHRMPDVVTLDDRPTTGLLVLAWPIVPVVALLWALGWLVSYLGRGLGL